MRKAKVHDSTEWFTAARAGKLSGLSPAMVNYLSREGFVEPTCKCKRGHGSPRHYSFGDVVALRLVAHLAKAGVSLLKLKKSLRRLRELHPDITLQSLPASHVVTDGEDIYLHKPGKSIERLFDGQFAFAFVVELAQIRKDVVKIMKSVPARRVAR